MVRAPARAPCPRDARSPLRCEGGSSGFVTLATKTEVGIGIEFNGTSQDSLMRAYVLSTLSSYAQRSYVR